MQERYRVQTRPVARKENIVQGDKYRITILTNGLIRLEYAEDGIFEDRATKLAFFRDFPECNYRVLHTEDGIEIHTARLHLVYNEKEFSSHGLSIEVKGNIVVYGNTWHYGEDFRDLGGTARTLDRADGEVPLDRGVMSNWGFSLLDDSESQVLLEDGWIEPRKKGVKDLYFFGYAHDYKEALKDFYYLCGQSPMLPRYALGNWWSRYYKYTEESYLELMDRFEKENLPFTVAVIDMDWHLVNIDPKYGSGWTGFTWNKEYFPDPKRFLGNLHDRGMRATLNIHPAGGVQAHEEMYLEMAKEMGVDYENEDPVACDPANPAFLEAYFKYLHHPREEEGVDFWWIDWQQGTNTKIEGLDPLWIFNHFYYLDSKRDGKRPMTFSRYAGPGSHRYPIGFSGDTVTSWESLDFQPYFTATASNIGYGWWSHDIGGHMLGCKDDERAARWLQYGIFSPIMRLHSSCSEFNGKEPWRFKKEAEVAMGDALRQRHQMIPYLYTMNYRSYKDSLPLVTPLYYDYPNEFVAYRKKNQFMFGSELMVAPITTKRVPEINRAKVNVWLPEGKWYDIYTGLMYDGGRMIDMYRDLSSIPVLAKAGAILPFTDEISSLEATKNPTSFRVKVYAGADGVFELYEDDNETCGYETGDCVKTKFEYQEQEKSEFIIHPAVGNLKLIPEKRSYVVELVGFRKAAKEQVKVLVAGQEVNVTTSYNSKTQAVVVEIPATCVNQEIRISVDATYIQKENPVEELCFDFLNQAEISFILKDQIYHLIKNEKRIPILIAQMGTLGLEENLYGTLMEIITAKIS